MTREEIEKALTDPNCWVRWAVVRRTDVELTDAQIERALADEDEDVRRAAEERLSAGQSPGLR